MMRNLTLLTFAALTAFCATVVVAHAQQPTSTAAKAPAAKAPAAKAPATKSPAATKAPAARAPSTKVSAEMQSAVDVHLKRLTVDEKIGQLMFLGFGGTVMDNSIVRFLEDKKPGGVALFGRNVKHLGQVMKLIREVRAHDPAGVPMYVSVDQEGGNVIRLKRHVTMLPSAMALGAVGDDDLAFRFGAALGADLSLMGFNMNLAPVLDINSNPKNPVIGTRSFGERPELVGRLGNAYIRGLQSAGVSAVAKHFPGHGDAESDSHHALPVLQHDRARLDAVELKPFRAAFENGLDGLMTAHIALPNIAEEKGMPATVSKNVLDGILRKDLGYDGLVITDGLEMAGIVDTYGSGEAAVRAVVAGADMVMVLWFVEKKNEVHAALRKAVKSGRISKARLDQSVRRILITKMRRGLFKQKLVPLDEAAAQLKAKKRPVGYEVARRALTLVKNDAGLLPLSAASGDKVVVATSEMSFGKELGKHLPQARVIKLRAKPTKTQLKRAVAQVVREAKGADVVVVGILDGRNLYLPAALQKALAGTTTKVAVVNFGSPYALSHFPTVDAYLCTFGFRWESEVAAARAVVGKIAPTGTLPVTVGADFPYGHRLLYAE